MKKQNTDKFVNLDNFHVDNKVVSVNGKELPISIGDRIKFGDDDFIVKTVMGIQINEDDRINYILEWYDPSDGSFKSEPLTLSELKLMSKNAFSKKKIVLVNG